MKSLVLLLMYAEYPLYSVCLFFHGQQCLCVNVCEKYFVCDVVVCRFRCSHSALVEIDDDGNE